MARDVRNAGVRDAGVLPLDPPAPSSTPPGASGHRERLRARALAGGLEALPDYELLELHLYRSIPRQDTKAIAKALLTRFGTLGAVLSAPITDLRTVKGVGESVALDLKLMHEGAKRIGREPIRRRTVIASWTALLDYVRVNIQHEPREQFRVLFLDKKNQLIADEVMNHGTVDHAPVYPREIVRRAIELSATAVILAHNHPSGDPEPSRADIAMTHEVIRAGKVLNVIVHDHLVVGRQGVVSLAQRGVLNPPVARGASLASR